MIHHLIFRIIFAFVLLSKTFGLQPKQIQKLKINFIQLFMEIKNSKNVKESLFEFFGVSYSYSGQLPVAGRRPLSSAPDLLDDLFAGKKQLTMRFNEKSEALPNRLYEVSDKVYLVRLHNKQIISYIKQTEGEEGSKSYSSDIVESYPYLYFVVDNRNNKTRIAIMKSPVFGNNCDKVCRVLNRLITLCMEPYGIEVELTNQRIPMRFWTYVEKCRKEGHRLMSLNINFYNPNYKTINKPRNLRKNVASMLNLAAITNALKGQIKLFAPPASAQAMEINNRMKDISQIVGLCSSNDFVLEAKFRGMELYKYNGDESVKAIFAMPTSAITEMVESEDNVDGFIEWPEGTKRGLIIWLDQSYLKINDYNTEARKYACI